MNLAPVAEEVRNPQRNIPLSLLIGVGTVIALYLGVNLAYYMVLDNATMAQARFKETPVATGFAEGLLGPIGGLLASAAIMFSVFGALNGNLLAGPRLLYAMGEDRLAPRWLGSVHPRYHTPAAAIAVLSLWACLQVLSVAVLTSIGWLKLQTSPFDLLTDFAMFGAVIFETMAVLSIFIFRQRFPDVPRTYRCPGYPVVPALYAVLPLFVLVNMLLGGAFAALVGLVFIGMGALVYFAFGLNRPSGTKEPG
jgi:amino acid transporter